MTPVLISGTVPSPIGGAHAVVYLAAVARPARVLVHLPAHLVLLVRLALLLRLLHRLPRVVTVARVVLITAIVFMHVRSEVRQVLVTARDVP